MNHLNNSSNDQNVERPPHFKDVFNPNDSSQNENCINTNNIVASESRRPSLVVMPAHNHNHDIRSLTMSSSRANLKTSDQKESARINMDITNIPTDIDVDVDMDSDLGMGMNIELQGIPLKVQSSNTVPLASSLTNESIITTTPSRDIASEQSTTSTSTSSSADLALPPLPQSRISASQQQAQLMRETANATAQGTTAESLTDVDVDVDITVTPATENPVGISTAPASSSSSAAAQATSILKSNLQFNQQLISRFQMLNIPQNRIPVNNNKKTHKSSKSIKQIKKFRSKSLPNIHIPSHSRRHYNGLLPQPPMAQMPTQMQMQMQPQLFMSQALNTSQLHQRQLQEQQLLILPPVNLHSMHEIDLQEVLKNPQLRHDILYDPQLQFRPNLDGERGKRKRIQSENYWNMIKIETQNFLHNDNFRVNGNSPIIIMFQCLKSILISLIPSKDITQIEEILDMSLLIQQINSKCFNFTGFANWICSIFKLHCAPMRDAWVDELNSLFYQSAKSDSLNIDYLVEGFKTLFLILEAMKLDVANHQIRILRPLLCSSAVSFEREYFRNAIKRNKINFTSSLIWFKKHSLQPCNNGKNPREVLNYAILNLLSCSKMSMQFPNTLNFDHTRLLLLRADIRHIVCTKLCFILYKTMVRQYKLDDSLVNDTNLMKLKSEILNIIVDDNGNSKWTKNLKNLAIHVVNKLFNNLDNDKIDFAYNWLLKQTQPSSPVYTILETKLFEKILPFLETSSIATDKVTSTIANPLPNSNAINATNAMINASTPISASANITIPTASTSTTLKNNNSASPSASMKINDDIVINDELANVVDRLNQLIEFNYNVFSDMYVSHL